MPKRKRRTNEETLMNAFQRMLARYGERNWWPGDSPLEIIIGAVLTQNTNWRNVEKAIRNLKENRLIDLQRLLSLKVADLEELIRPAGYFRIKTKRLRNLLTFISREYGDEKTMLMEATDTLRRKLLAVNGIGPETADCILLYAGERPTFVIDTYTHRVAKRHDWIAPDADYAELKTFFETQLDSNVDLFHEYHALLVEVGKDHCKPTPLCENCPLEDTLPVRGPRTWPMKN